MAEQTQIRNILVFRNDRFGEFLLNIPAFRALKESFPSARLILVLDPYVKPLAERLNYIDEIIEWRSGRHRLTEKIKIIRFLRAKNIDMAVMLNPSRDFNIITYLAGIPLRVGYDRKFSFLLTSRMGDEKYLGLKHEVEYNLELVALAGAHTQDKSLSLNIDKEIAGSLLKKSGIKEGDMLVAIHPWTSVPLKQWPLENFISLIDKLLKRFPVKIIVVGGREEAVKSPGFFNGLGVNVANLSGKTTLLELGALLKACRVLVSADSGPVHLAASVGTPAVAIFRNDIPGKNPERWGPWGERHVVIGKSSLRDITVDEVFQCTKKFLS